MLLNFHASIREGDVIPKRDDIRAFFLDIH
jgi:hypothetical protein